MTDQTPRPDPDPTATPRPTEPSTTNIAPPRRSRLGRWPGRQVPLVVGIAGLLLGCVLGAGVAAVGAVVAGHWHEGGHSADRGRHDGHGRDNRKGAPNSAPTPTIAPAPQTTLPATPSTATPAAPSAPPSPTAS